MHRLAITKDVEIIGLGQRRDDYVNLSTRENLWKNKRIEANVIKIFLNIGKTVRYI